MTYQNIIFEHAEPGIYVLTVNRPKALNSLNAATLDELASSVVRVAEDAEARVLLVTGAGDKAFVAGADISAMQTMSPLEAQAFSEKGTRVMQAIETLPVPVIGLINGYALGGGCELAMACDWVIAGERAVFGFSPLEAARSPQHVEVAHGALAVLGVRCGTFLHDPLDHYQLTARWKRIPTLAQYDLAPIVRPVMHYALHHDRVGATRDVEIQFRSLQASGDLGYSVTTLRPGAAPLNLNVVSVNPAVLKVSATSVTFGPGDGSKTIRLTGLTPGSASVRVFTPPGYAAAPRDTAFYIVQ